MAHRLDSPGVCPVAGVSCLILALPVWYNASPCRGARRSSLRRRAARRHSGYYDAGGVLIPNQSDLDNHANQMNPNNDAYWESRGLDERPEDWDERVYGGDDDDYGDEDYEE